MAATTTVDVKAALEEIRPVIEEHANQGEVDRDLAPAVYAAFRRSGLNRLALPASYGGLEVDPVTATELFEEVGAIDGSAAWVLNQQYAVSLLATWAADGMDEFFADPDASWSGVFWPPGSATRADGGYRVTGKVGFASGCSHADWFLAPAVVMDDGEPIIDPATGQPDFIATILPMSDLNVIDTWHTLGMRGTGSNDVVISEVFVPVERTAKVFGLAPRPEALRHPAYHLVPWPAVHAHAAVPVGIARGALRQAVELAATKVPNFLQVALKDKHVVQGDLARARSQLESASAYLRHTMRTAMAAAEAGTFGAEEQISLQLSANHAAGAASEAMRLIHQTVGTTTVRDETGLARRFRDLHTITQHASLQPARWESAGKVMLGLESDWFPFAL